MNKTLIRTGLVVLAGLLILAVALGFTFKKEALATPAFITSNPLNLTEIAFISPFRSCMGHDYSGKNIQGEKESNRSMKHYVGLIHSTAGSKTAVFSPFEGKIVQVSKEQSRADNQVWIQPEKAKDFAFVFFHIDLMPELKKGSVVKSGQLIGYANIKETGDNFDIALKKTGILSGPSTLVSPFDYMTAEVLQEFERRGITKQNIIVSKEERDSKPCNFVPGSNQDEIVPLQ